MDGIRKVVYLDGSLPDGGMVADTPIYTAAAGSFLSKFASYFQETSKVMLELEGQLAFYVENVVTSEEAKTLIDLSESFTYSQAAPGIHTPAGMRQNKTVHWIAPKELMQTLFMRVQPHLPAVLEERPLCPRLSHRINMYRYDSGDAFNLHIDGDWPGFELSDGGTKIVQWDSCRSMLTMLLYLNGVENGIEGGETHLFAKGEQKISVQPKTGRALFFRHGHTSESVLHAGAAVSGSVAKYVARINVMYDFNLR